MRRSPLRASSSHWCHRLDTDSVSPEGFRGVRSAAGASPPPAMGDPDLRLAEAATG